MKEPEIETGRPKEHPSYGVVQVSRVSGDTALFDSNVQHMGYIVLRINRAYCHDTELSEHVFGAGECITEVAMSEAQWVAMVSRLNCGSGTPCTLKYLRTGKMEKVVDPPGHESMVDRIRRRKRVHQASTERRLGERFATIRALAEELPPKRRDKLLHELQILNNFWAEGNDFAKSQLDEFAEKVIVDAKVEIDAFVQGTVTALGLQSLGQLLQISHDTERKP